MIPFENPAAVVKRSAKWSGYAGAQSALPVAAKHVLAVPVEVALLF